jgi:hypothetical protein
MVPAGHRQLLGKPGPTSAIFDDGFRFLPSLVRWWDQDEVTNIFRLSLYFRTGSSGIQQDQPFVISAVLGSTIVSTRDPKDGYGIIGVYIRRFGTLRHIFSYCGLHSQIRCDKSIIPWFQPLRRASGE